MRKFTLFTLLLILPLMIDAADRFKDGIQRTQKGDYTASIDWSGNSFDHAMAHYYLTNKFAVGLGFNFDRDKTTFPNDDTETSSTFGVKASGRYEFCGDDSPVIGHVAPWLSYERVFSGSESGDNGDFSSESTTNWVGFGVCVGGEIYFNKQFAVGINADLAYYTGSQSLESGGESSDGNSYSNFRFGLTPRLSLTWNFN